MLSDFEKNCIYMQWRYYVGTFMNMTEVSDLVVLNGGPDLNKVADEYFEFLKSNDITEYREMHFLRKYDTFDFNYIHEIIGITLTLKNSKKEMLKLYNGFKNYMGTLLGTYEGYKGLNYELRNPFPGSIDEDMMLKYRDAYNSRVIDKNSYLWTHIIGMCRIGINNVCRFPDYFIGDNMPVMSNLMANIGCYKFLRSVGIRITNSKEE